MLRTSVCLVAMLLVAGSLHTASAQTTTAPAATTAAPADAKPSKMKLTMQKLKDITAKWSPNNPKLAPCRKEAKSEGLPGHDCWFNREDCLVKSGACATARCGVTL